MRHHPAQSSMPRAVADARALLADAALAPSVPASRKRMALPSLAGMARLVDIAALCLLAAVAGKAFVIAAQIALAPLSGCAGLTPAECQAWAEEAR